MDFILQALQTCACPKQNRDLSRICPLPLALASQLGKWSSATPCPVAFLPAFSLHPYHPALVHVPIVFFLDCSKRLITALPRSSLPPSKLYPAARKVVNHKSSHVTIFFKVCSDYQFPKNNRFHWCGRLICKLFIPISQQLRLAGHLSGTWIHLEPSLPKAFVQMVPWARDALPLMLCLSIVYLPSSLTCSDSPQWHFQKLSPVG